MIRETTNSNNRRSRALRAQRRNRHLIRSLAPILFFICFVIVLVLQSRRGPNTNHAVQTRAPQSKQNGVTNTIQTFGSSIEKKLQKANGDYAIAYINLTEDDSYFVSADKAYEAGSLYKLWVMATTYELIESDELTQDQLLSEQVSVLNESFQIASESAEKTEGMVELSVRDALFQMITYSDNYAAMLLSSTVRLSRVGRFLDQYGFADSSVGSDGSAPRTTARDIAQFYKKLYEGELANHDHTQDMIDLLTQQKLNNKLPALLPPNTQIAHKTGEIGYFSHDAGIVYTSSGNYVIVVLSKSDDPRGANKHIARISKRVYEHASR